MKNIKTKYLIIGLILLTLTYFIFFSSPNYQFPGIPIKDKNPISDNATINRITFHGEPAKNIFVRTPYIADSDKYRFANVAVDINGNKTIEKDEWLVINTPIFVEKDTATRFTVSYPDQSLNNKKDLVTTVVLSYNMMDKWSTIISKSVKKSLLIPEVTYAEMGGVFFPDRKEQKETGFFKTVNSDHGHEDSNTGSEDVFTGKVIQPDESMIAEEEYIELKVDLNTNIWSHTDKYYGYEYELDTDENNEDDSKIEPPTLTLDEPESKDDEVVEEPETTSQPETPTSTEPERMSIKVEEMPDIDQKYNECAPTAVANSFRWLADKHGFSDRIPTDNGDLINELKGYMMRDFGTAPGNTLDGKRTFIQERGLPIEAHLVGEENDPNILEKIYAELKKGQAVEVSLQFYKVGEGGKLEKDGAHLATVSGINDYTRSGGSKWLDLNDPATHEKDGKPSSDPNEIVGNELINYWSGGKTFIRYAVAQSPIFDDDGNLIDIGSNSNLVLDDNGLALNKQSVTRGVGHFGFFNVDFDGVGDHFVGDSFKTTIVVRSTGKENTIRWSGENYKVKMMGPWNLEGEFKTSTNISPNALSNRPPNTGVNGESFRLETTFTCSEEGNAYIEYTTNLSWKKTGEGEVPEKIKEEYGDEIKTTDTITVRSPTFRCVPKTPPVEEMSITDIPSSFSCEGFPEHPEGKEIELLKLGNKCYPKFQFRGGGNAHDNCGVEHYHGAKSDIVYSLDGSAKSDPDVNACGFGKIVNVEQGTIKLTPNQMSPFISKSVFEE